MTATMTEYLDHLAETSAAHAAALAADAELTEMATLIAQVLTGDEWIELDFAALDLNVRKLESRPIPGSDFEFTFYFDLEADLNAPGVLPLLGSLSRDIPSLTFLGAYSEV